MSFPDIPARTRALELWLNQGHGRLTERVEQTIDARAALVKKTLAEMTEEELLVLAASADGDAA